MIPFCLIGGSASLGLLAEVAKALDMAPSPCDSMRFPDGEVSVTLHGDVRARDLFILQSTGPPVDENLIELLALVDAGRRASARRVIAVVPYFGYARSDKRERSGEPIMASAVARMLEGAGVNQLITLDLHAAQIEGFFQIPTDSLSAVPLLCGAIRLPGKSVVVSPDEGRVKTATAYARILGLPIAVLHKERHPRAEPQMVHVVGELRDRTCLIIDDLVSTGGTLACAIEAVLRAGARPGIQIAATHGVMLPGAMEKLNHPGVDQVVITDSLPLTTRWPRLRVISIAALLADAIRRASL